MALLSRTVPPCPRLRDDNRRAQPLKTPPKIDPPTGFVIFDRTGGWAGLAQRRAVHSPQARGPGPDAAAEGRRAGPESLCAGRDVIFDSKELTK